MTNHRMSAVSAQKNIHLLLLPNRGQEGFAVKFACSASRAFRCGIRDFYPKCIWNAGGRMKDLLAERNVLTRHQARRRGRCRLIERGWKVERAFCNGIK